MLTARNIPALMPKIATKCFLATTEIFKKAPADILREMEKKMVERKYAKQESIFLEGDPAESVWFVKEGYVKAEVHAASGRCQTLCMVGATQMFGSCCSFGGGEYPCHTVAETDVTVVSLPMAEFLSLLSRVPEMSSALVAQLSKRLRESKDMQTFEQESVEKRILHVLAKMTELYGTTIPLTRREIAEMAGTTVETSIRTFSKLEETGLVSSARGRITIRNIQALRGRIDEI